MYTMTPLQSSIWEFLCSRYTGAENAMPRAAILARYNLLRVSELDDRTFRETVSELVRLHKKAICTSPGRGYFVARTAREKDEAINYLKSAGAEIFERARDLEAADPLERQERLF